MAMIPQNALFGWKDEINDLGDLARLQLVMEHIPDEGLLRLLEKGRGKGRDDFPIRAMWNLVLAGIVFQHSSDASLLRELTRNGQLKHFCGFGFGKIPSAHNLSRFRSLLLKHHKEVESIFVHLTDQLYRLRDDFGKETAMDSKWVESAANRVSKRKKPDGRSEVDAKKGVKAIFVTREDGVTYEKKVHCFGFKVHLLVDSRYELPIAYMVTDAATSDIAVGRRMLKYLEVNRPEVLKAMSFLTADKGYDDRKLIVWLKDRGIKSVIDKRKMWRAETEKQVSGYENAYYNESGEVYCYCPCTGESRMMVANGYDRARDTSRFKCPAKAYGVKCAGMDRCHCKSVRIPLSTDPRIFTQVQRSTCKWKRLYRKRTSVERVNSRFDVSLGFEERRVRGKARMTLNVSLALSVMQAMAIGHIVNKREALIRSLVRVA